MAAIGMSADITVKVDPTVATKDVDVEYGYIADMIKPRAERPEPTRDNIKVTDGKFVIKTLPQGPAQYVIPVNEREYVVIYTKPGDDLTVNLTSVNPLKYDITGSKLMADISKLDNESSKVLESFQQLRASGNVTEEAVEKIQNEYNTIFKDYIKENPTAEAIPFAIMHLEGEDFMNAYSAMTPEAKQSPIALFLEPQKEYVEKQLAMEARKAQLQSGNVDAPNFTFATIDGKQVSLSDFKGKWVVIDFWGSWCPWCIKGFPALKEAYAKYKPQLEVVGVACNDKRDAWEAALKKYELPWVNVYNPEEGGGKVLEEYGVEGFPTKVIVSPEGKIRNITSGENPAFFDVLGKLINGNDAAPKGAE